MKMEISILYHVIVNSQSNRDNLTRCYIIFNNKQWSLDQVNLKATPRSPSLSDSTDNKEKLCETGRKLSLFHLDSNHVLRQ